MAGLVGDTPRRQSRPPPGTWPPGPGIELLKYSARDSDTFSTLFCLKLAKSHQIDANSLCGKMGERLFPWGKISAAYLFRSPISQPFFQAGPRWPTHQTPDTGLRSRRTFISLQKYPSAVRFPRLHFHLFFWPVSRLNRVRHGGPMFMRRDPITFFLFIGAVAPAYQTFSFPQHSKLLSFCDLFLFLSPNSPFLPR